jgi:outer membrane protein TolC
MSRFRRVLVAVCLGLAGVVPVRAQQLPAPLETVTFQQAIDRAVRNNPSVAVAAAGILRAEGLLKQARAATLPLATGSVVTTTLNKGVETTFSSGGTSQSITIVPRTQVTFALTADMPVVAAAAWARRAQAVDNAQVADLNAAEVRRQVALSTADAYLTIIASRRVVGANTRARDTAQAHFALATQLEQRGTGSHLNTLRAQQEVSTDQQLVESSMLALYRAQEALGVLLVSDGPVDAVEEPTFEVPPQEAARPAGAPAPDLLMARTDLKLFSGQVNAAKHVLRDSSRDWWPSLDALFQPQSIYPAGFFAVSNSWRFLLQASIPIFDSGERASQRVQRQAAVDQAQANLTAGLSQAASEVRVARVAVASDERGLTSARAAADEAQQVVNIVNVSFRAGASTNIEVIDAERTARDADTAVDTLRRARLDLLVALGRFPQ